MTAILATKIDQMECGDLEDKLKAARHEAGHLTVWLAIGGDNCDARIALTADGWDGESYSRINVAHPENAREIHGFAGIAAEWWATHPECSAGNVISAIDDGRLKRPSTSDLAWFRPGAEVTREAMVSSISGALALLRGNRDYFSWAVARLMATCEITEDEAWTQFSPPYTD